MNQQLSPSEEQAFAIWLQQNRPEFTGNIVDIDGVVVDELIYLNKIKQTIIPLIQTQQIIPIQTIILLILILPILLIQTLIIQVRCQNQQQMQVH
jgi:hypothetical protein